MFEMKTIDPKLWKWSENYNKWPKNYDKWPQINNTIYLKWRKKLKAW